MALKIRWIAVLLLILSFFSAGCALFQTKEKEAKDLLPVRNVKVVPFPVRPLEFEELRARQEKDQLIISGSIKNISYSPVADVRVRAIIFLAEDQGVLTLSVSAAPPVLQPGESGQFSLTGIVALPVSRVELHSEWQEYYPPAP